MRAFLQRSEVRLSTMHRVATALLSGAGILVLIPALEHEAVTNVLRTLLVGPVSWSRGLLAVAVVCAIVLALAVLWLVVVELTRFYFHSNHVVHDEVEVFTPRFTLTGLRLPVDELDEATTRDYEGIFAASRTLRLLVPRNAKARERVDTQLRAYPGLGQRLQAAADDDSADRARSEGLFELAAARRRSLAGEVVKVEYGIVRHMLRLQVIVLRYVKALLVVVLTTVAVFGCAAAVNEQLTISAADERWIAGVMLLWAPAVLLVVSSPVRWLDSLLRSEGAQQHAASRDREFTRLEDFTARLAVGVWAVAVTAMVLLRVHHPVSSQGGIAVVAVMAVSAVGFVVVFSRRWRIRHERSRGLLSLAGLR
jgi:hypothetical protein